MYYTTICAIAKDENIHLKEWVLYHLAIGFEHFVIYDNNSKVPISEELAEYVAAGLVTVIDWPMTDAQQMSAYVDCLGRLRSCTYWLAFIDIDEFIVPLQKRDVRDFLDDYKQYGGVGMHWMMFASNGHVSRPQGGILENYTSALYLAPHIKSIVRPGVTLRPASVHHCHFSQGHYCVNEDGVVIHSFCSYPVGEKIRINHYYYRSQQDFEEKIARGLATKIKSGADRDMGIFYDHLAMPCKQDEKILGWLPLVRKFSSLSATTLAQIVTAPLHKDIAVGIQAVSDCLMQGEIERAKRAFVELARYHHTPQMAILEASLAFWEDDVRKGMDVLSRALLENAEDGDTVALLFAEIAKHYEREGKPDTAALVREFGHG